MQKCVSVPGKETCLQEYLTFPSPCPIFLLSSVLEIPVGSWEGCSCPVLLPPWTKGSDPSCVTLTVNNIFQSLANQLYPGLLCFEDLVWQIVSRPSHNSMSILPLLRNWILNLVGKAMLIARKVSLPSLSGSWMWPSNQMLTNEIQVERLNYTSRRSLIEREWDLLTHYSFSCMESKWVTGAPAAIMDHVVILRRKPNDRRNISRWYHGILYQPGLLPPDFFYIKGK